MLASRPMSADPATDPPVQLNIRVPASVKAAAQERAEFKGMKVGKWVETAILFALQEHGVTVTPSGRTATPPHRRHPATRTGANL